MPDWIDALAERVEEALANLEPQVRSGIPIIFTAHSLPRPVVDRDPGTSPSCRTRLRRSRPGFDLSDDRWSFAYQSAGHTPEEWLTPDVKISSGVRSQGITEILVVPLQFLADHLEILYDIDIAAGEERPKPGSPCIASRSQTCSRPSSVPSRRSSSANATPARSSGRS